MMSKKHLITQIDIDTWKSLKHIPREKYYEEQLYALLDLYIKFINEKHPRCLPCVDDWNVVKNEVATFFGVHQEEAQKKIDEIENYTKNE